MISIIPANLSTTNPITISSKKKRVSVDFDFTLTTFAVKEYVKELIERGFEVHIVTSRPPDNITVYVGTHFNQDLHKVAEKLLIPKSNIHFLNFRNKYLFFQENPGFLWHLDDSDYELNLIKLNCKTPGIRVYQKDWKIRCEMLNNTN